MLKNFRHRLRHRPRGVFCALASWVSAVVLLQTLYFKFSAQPESVYIFTEVGMEPYGRIGIGAAELVASLMLIMPRLRVYGAVLSFFIMGGAVGCHLFGPLGTEVQGDGGMLFVLALIVFGSSLFVGLCNYRTLLNALRCFKGAGIKR